MTVESGNHPLGALNRYERFFITGSFLMEPKLFFDATSKQLTIAAVRMGLALDDCWDFGVERNAHSGRFIRPDSLNKIVDEQIFSRFLKARDYLFNLVDKPTEDTRYLLRTNLERFEQGIMLTESLALAVPCNSEKATWDSRLLDIYRAIDAMVWGAMYVALKPKSRLILPDLSIFANSYSGNPSIGLSDLYTYYHEYLLQEQDDGFNALSLAWQMMYVQIEMDRQDRKINELYHSPAFHTFFEEDEWLKQRKRDYLNKARDFQRNASISRLLARLFPIVYSTLSHSEKWRNIQGWRDKYIQSKVKV